METFLQYSALPFWTGLQDEPGIRHTYPFSLVWDKHGFIRQENQESVLDEIVTGYSEQDYAFITAPPGRSVWADELGDLMVEFSGKIIGSAKDAAVLEIGAGSLYVARKLVDKGNISRYVVVDPALADEDAGDSRITVIPMYIDDYDPVVESFDFAFSFNCLEHVPKPLDLLSKIRQALSSDRAGVGLIFPEIERQFETGDLNAILHEHLNYFTARTARRLFEGCGFSIISSRVHADELQVVLEARSPITNADREASEEKARQPDELALTLSQRFQHSVERSKNLLDDARERGLSVAFHGATNGLNNLLYLLGLSRCREYQIYDADEAKVGRYLPALPVPIRHSTDASYKNIDLVLVAATTFFSPIREFIVGEVGLGEKAIEPLFPLEPEV